MNRTVVSGARVRNGHRELVDEDCAESVKVGNVQRTKVSEEWLVHKLVVHVKEMVLPIHK